jgi:hypothetical protein
VDNIKMDLREIRWDGVDWIDMAQIINLRVPKNAGGFLMGCTIDSSSRRAELRK